MGPERFLRPRRSRNWRAVKLAMEGVRVPERVVLRTPQFTVANRPGRDSATTWRVRSQDRPSHEQQSMRGSHDWSRRGGSAAVMLPRKSIRAFPSLGLHSVSCGSKEREMLKKK
ncbi:hypothetical protein DM860_017247 [Cuscuta australis]|uniref:Uncharacterized protein n=1 Tax=Cuscuta australis TaxID=267555 RepID=A0A328E7T4_9ASTE|nr:hypothetical protein DM860_017247 [Cuscuta australis]